MKVAALAGLVLMSTPRSAAACATCISSPFGDQTYAWPYLGLILLPFGLIVAIVGILGYLSLKARERDGYHPRVIVRPVAGYFGAKDDPQIIKETT
jgi:hypothetical protein